MTDFGLIVSAFLIFAGLIVVARSIRRVARELAVRNNTRLMPAPVPVKTTAIREPGMPAGRSTK